MLNPEVGYGDLVLVELAERTSLSVQGGRDVLLPVKGDQRRVDGILARPPERRSRQRLADVRSRLPSADRGEHLLTHGVLFGGAGIAGRLERMVSALPGALDDSFPCC